MGEEKLTEARAVEPMTVAVIGTGDGARLPSGTVAETSGLHQPNIVVQVVSPLLALTIRLTSTFLTVFGGILLGAAGTSIIPFTDFRDLVVKSAGLAVCGTCLSFVKDLITIFGKLEQKYPLWTGNV